MIILKPCATKKTTANSEIIVIDKLRGVEKMKIARVIICAVLVVLFLSFQAQDVKALTYTIDYNIGDPGDGDTFNPKTLDEFLSHNGASHTEYQGTFSGNYTATFIGYRASNKNKFFADAGAAGTVFFETDSNASSLSSHSIAGDYFSINAASAHFDDTTDQSPTNVNLGDSQYLSYYSLNSDWAYTGNSGVALNFNARDIIVGFGDASGDNDNLDLVVALRANPVPIPGAFWLLGSGLLGLVGIRRRPSKA